MSVIGACLILGYRWTRLEQAKEDFVEQSLITQTISLSLFVSEEIKEHNPVRSNGKTKSINKASVLLSTPR